VRCGGGAAAHDFKMRSLAFLLGDYLVG